MKIGTTLAAAIAVLSIALLGCDRPPKIDGITVTNGTAVLMFPEWMNSASAFERVVYSNYFAVYKDGKWFTRERQADGTLAVFWKSDSAYENIQDAKTTFGMNIQWNVSKGLYDAFSK
ncbi:MAG: hypothetical protein WC477_07160 [Patescibacteria group bacterium]